VLNSTSTTRGRTSRGCVERAATGEEIVIARAGEPIAKLVPYSHGEQRVPGVVTARIVLDSIELPRGRL